MFDFFLIGIEVDKTIELANEDENRLWMSSSILQITPERMYHNMKAVCVVRWKDEEPIRLGFLRLLFSPIFH